MAKNNAITVLYVTSLFAGNVKVHRMGLNARMNDTKKKEKVGMTVVRKEINISAAHQLPFHQGKCLRPHGHNYRVVAYAKGERDANGLVIDFYDVSSHLESTVGRFDHTDLNPMHRVKKDEVTSILGATKDGWIPTTAENLAEAWLYDLQQLDARYCGLRVWETDTCYAQAGVTE